MYTRIHCIYTISNSINDIMEKSDYVISSQILKIVFVMDREILNLHKDISNTFLSNHREYYILQEELEQMVQITDDAKRNIPIEKIKMSPKNSPYSINAFLNLMKDIDILNSIMRRLHADKRVKT